MGFAGNTVLQGVVIVNYGLSYMGSKSRLALEIIKLFPHADNFYDLFAGGCAITHALMLNNTDICGNKYNRFYANDILGTPELFLDAIAGKYKDEKRWISSEQFHAEKNTNLYIKWIWSYGNNGTGYLFSRELEPIKKAFHYVVVFDDWTYFEDLYSNEYLSKVLAKYNCDDSKLLLDMYKSQYQRGSGRKEHLRVVKWCQNNYYKKVSNIRVAELERLQQLERLERLQQLEQLERIQQLEQLQQLERLSNLTISKFDYRDVNVLPNSVVYCDIPYNTGGINYVKDFDHLAFWEWAEAQQFPIYVSEYKYSGNNPDKWEVVWSKDVVNLRGSISGNLKDGNRKISTEKIFWNRKELQ